MVDGAGGVTAREYSELLRRRQQADAKKWEEMEKKVTKMEAEQLEVKKKARKAAVKTECDKYTNKSIKRGVKVQMETNFWCAEGRRRAVLVARGRRAREGRQVLRL